MKEHVLKQKSSRVVDIKQKKNNDFLTNINIMQRYINMRGKIYNNFMDFTEAYAKHFSIKDYAILTLIWDYLKYAFDNDYHFNSYNDIIAKVIPYQNTYLPINPLYMITNSQCTIDMTGSRNADYQRANQYYQNPGNYIWHHIEGVRYVLPHYKCDMILTEPKYHAQRHVGAVKQYELLTGKKYNP